ASDIQERQYWDKYMKAYEKAIGETATKENPWYIIPADKKWFTRIAISTIILDHLSDLKLRYPVLLYEEKEKLKAAKEALQKE
ncbi:MAG TPA: polyphosphate kinase 2 family protein, partial [Mucilaginibacter sp.]|nr:polyphosphate kinase 2 family protein [Mucilaginibacter sp.]